MNVADIIVHNGTDPVVKDRVFIQFRDDAEVLQAITYSDFYKRSLALRQHAFRYEAVLTDQRP